MPSPTCTGTHLEFDCTADTAELRCPECGVKLDVWPVLQGKQWRGRLPYHPPRRN